MDSPVGPSGVEALELEEGFNQLNHAKVPAIR